MSRLAHNDYLEQASDSGLPGSLAYALLVVAAVAWGFPKAERGADTSSGDWLVFSVWLGVLGWSLQSLVEFGLYIPALAWPAFTFLGWLLGRKRPTPNEAPRPATSH
jgi:O-antigen ligase